MKKATLLILYPLLLAAGANAQEEDPDPATEAEREAAAAEEELPPLDPSIYAVINGQEIPFEMVQAMIGTNQVPQEQLNNILRRMVRSIIIAQEAKRRGYDQSEGFLESQQQAKNRLLFSVFSQQTMRDNPISDEAIRARFDEFVEQFEGKQEYYVWHILVDDEERAQQLIEQIGGDPKAFNATAKEHSQDTGSGPGGGLLGWSLPEDYVPEFAAEVERLEVGGFSDKPIQTEFGWHILHLEQTRPYAAPEYTQDQQNVIRQDLQVEVLLQAAADLLDDPDAVNAETDEERSSLMNAIAAAVEQEDFARDPVLLSRLELIEYQLLSDIFAREFIAENPITEGKVQERYDLIAAEREGTEEHLLHHILVADEDQAKQLIETIGSDLEVFKEQAKEVTLDPSNRTNGGYLGWVQLHTMVRPFADAVLAMEEGEFSSEPVQTRFGWHIIHVADRKPFDMPNLDENEIRQIRAALENEIISLEMERLMRDAEIRINRDNGSS